MRWVTDLPLRVREIENIWIPVSDGIRLAARLWLPEDAEKQPVPAVLEYIPYRKRDMTAFRDSATHRYLAGHDYACLRLDVRGTGDSEGLFDGWFTARYVQDVLEAIDWISRQVWCTGSVAIFGLSWGAAIALRAATHRPTALRAIVCAAGYDDAYDLRYPGGCLSTAAVTSIVAQLSYGTRPPDPQIVGARWRDMWMARLAAVAPMTQAWLGHPYRDRTWHDESFLDDYEKIACPTMLAAGWADPAFASCMLRALSRLVVPRIGVFGPWAHRYPHFGIPEPAIGYLQITLQWLDRWMKGVEAKDANERRLRSFMPNGFTVASTPDTRTGRWVAEPDWPSRNIAMRDWWLGPDGLTPAPQASHRAALQASQYVGAAAGEFMPIFTTGANPELPQDQRDDDALSLVFDSAPLPETIEIVGTPLATFALQSDGSESQFVVRLCEVAPDGKSRRVSWGALNMALAADRSGQASHDPGIVYSITVPMFATADSFAPGHRIRIAVSGSYWPILWPSAKQSRITLETGRCRLSLPVRPPSNGNCDPPPPPEAAPTSASRCLRPGAYRVRTFVDDATGERVVDIADDMGESRLEDISLSFTETTKRLFRIRPESGKGAVVETETSCAFRRNDWAAGTVVRGRVADEGGTLRTHHRIEATEEDRVVFTREWQSQIPK